MNDSDKIKMYLNIGDQPISLTVPAARQEFVRAVEADINRLFDKWRRTFPSKTDREIISMVAYQYASFYGELKERYEEAAYKAEQCLNIALEDANNRATDSESEIQLQLPDPENT